MSFRHAMPVRFADIDHAGIVYFAKFFDYCHVTLEEYIRSRCGPAGYVDLLDRRRIGFPAVRTECQFTAPLRFGDIMEVELRIERLGRKSISFGFRIHKQAPEDGGEQVLCAHGQYVVAVVDLEQFRAVAIPDELREIFAPLIPPDSSPS